MTTMEAQTKQILRYMEDGNSITDAIARDLFSCSRLSGRIYDLRHDGVPILDDFEYKLDERGKVVKKWKKYWIAADPQAQSASL